MQVERVPLVGQNIRARMLELNGGMALFATVNLWRTPREAFHFLLRSHTSAGSNVKVHVSPQSPTGGDCLFVLV